jgi:hypothetical protein
MKEERKEKERKRGRKKENKTIKNECCPANLQYTYIDLCDMNF